MKFTPHLLLATFLDIRSDQHCVGKDLLYLWAIDGSFVVEVFKQSSLRGVRGSLVISVLDCQS